MTKTWHKALFVVVVVFAVMIAINNDPTGILPKIASFRLFGQTARPKAA